MLCDVCNFHALYDKSKCCCLFHDFYIRQDFESTYPNSSKGVNWEINLRIHLFLELSLFLMYISGITFFSKNKGVFGSAYPKPHFFHKKVTSKMYFRNI